MDLAGQVVAHLRSYLPEHEVRKVLEAFQKDIAKFVHVQMQDRRRTSHTVDRAAVPHIDDYVVGHVNQLAGQVPCVRGPFFLVQSALIHQIRSSAPPGAPNVFLLDIPAAQRDAVVALIAQQPGIVSTPGTGFGPSGEGYFRLTLTAPEARLKLAVKRLAAYAKGKK